MKKIVIATIKPWNIENANIFMNKFIDSYDVKIVTTKERLSLNFLKEFEPDYIFFPHWSWIISSDIYQKYESIVFHMTDLPYGRGGSPLQNLIINKKYETKISAIKVAEGLDSGDIYLKKDFYIGLGSAQEIYQKISDIIFFDMIPEILNKKLDPKKQNGQITVFTRRTQAQSDLNSAQINSLVDLYDFIRMLDAQTYPKAYLDYKNFKISFEQVFIESGKLVGRFEIEEK